jgi:type II secretory pathway component GspD/PulD (secretin)
MKMSRFACGAAALLLLCASSALAQGVGKDARVDLRVEGRSLADVVQYLREKSGANIVVIGEPDEDKRELSLELSDVSWRDALDIAAEKVGFVVTQRTGGILVVEKPARVTIEFMDTPITHIVDTIAKLGGANIVVSPDVAGTLSLRFNEVPWRDALEAAVKTLGYVVIQEERGVLRVVDPKSLQAQMSTRSYQLRYLRPQTRFRPQIKSEFLQAMPSQTGQKGGQDVAATFTVLQALKKALNSGGEMDYIESQNVIIVRDTDQVHLAIKEMLARLDVEPAQVFVDVKFVSTLNSDLLDLGVDYGDGGPQVTASGGQIPITLPFGLGGKGWEDPIIVNTSGKGPFADPLLNVGTTVFPDTIFGALSFTQVQATLKLLQRDVKSDVIQAPRLIALDGREATIFVGETIRYAEAKSEQGQAGGLQLSLTEAQASPVEVGFQLLIVPHVIPGTNTLSMEVIPKETSLSGTGSSALAPAGFDVFTVGASGLEGSIALPRTRSSTIITTMLLESGQTAVIGGLTTDTDVRTESRVPGLASIPLVGELFKHRKKERQRRSLIVFITPSVVHTSADTEHLLQSELARRRARLKDEVEAMVDPSFRRAPAPIGEDVQ